MEADPDTQKRTRIRVKLSPPASNPPDAVETTVEAVQVTAQEFRPPQRPAFVGETYCRIHPHDLAHFFCSNCQRYFCELCVSLRPVEGVPSRFCRACGHACEPVISAVDSTREEPFVRLAWRALGYPFAGDGMFLLLSGTVLLFLIDVLSYVVSFAGLLGLCALVILNVFGGGYLFAFVKSVVLSSAQGSDTLPDWPDIQNPAQDLVGPFFQGVILVGLCMAPGVAALLYGAANANVSLEIGGGVLILVGLGYLPMGLLGIAMFDSVLGVNPTLGIPSIGRTLGHYSVTVLMFYLILGAGAGVELLLVRVIHVPVLSSLLAAFFNFYAVIVQARTVGVLYRVNKDVLGWFKLQRR